MTLDQTKASGAADLARTVTMSVDGLAARAAYTLSHERVDADHSNIAAVWGSIREDGQAWPDDSQWEQLRKADRLERLAPPAEVVADDQGRVSVTFALPMPAMSFLRLTPG
jgi:xylan 1,4-beta-xylosidase